MYINRFAPWGGAVVFEPFEVMAREWDVTSSEFCASQLCRDSG